MFNLFFFRIDVNVQLRVSVPFIVKTCRILSLSPVLHLPPQRSDDFDIDDIKSLSEKNILQEKMWRKSKTSLTSQLFTCLAPLSFNGLYWKFRFFFFFSSVFSDFSIGCTDSSEKTTEEKWKTFESILVVK